MSQPRRGRLRRLPWGAIGVLAAVAAGWLVYGILFPILRHGLAPAPVSPFGVVEWPLWDDLRRRLLEAFTVTWLFLFGASIGSFLNVVIYRCPRGMTLLGHSMCPVCRYPIRPQHNLPVLGWLLLRGRCRDCRLPISVRYPLVETVVGGLFVVLALVELFSGGGNLPSREPNRYRGIAWIVFDPQWDLIGLYAYHGGLLTMLLSWTLIWYDGQRVPAKYALFALSWALLWPVVAPDLHPVSAWGGVPPGVAGSFVTLASSGLGGVAGLLIGGGLTLWAARGPTAAWILGVWGLALGWQAAFSTALWIAPCALVQWLALRQASPRLARHAELSLWLACVSQLLTWRAMGWIPVWPSLNAAWYVFPIALVTAAWTWAEWSRWLSGKTVPGG